MPARVRVWRVETGNTVPGVADIMYVDRETAVLGWIENKIGEPKGHLLRLKNRGLTGDQKRFLLDMTAVERSCFVAIWSDEGDDHWRAWLLPVSEETMADSGLTVPITACAAIARDRPVRVARLVWQAIIDRAAGLCSNNK